MAAMRWTGWIVQGWIAGLLAAVSLGLEPHAWASEAWMAGHDMSSREQRSGRVERIARDEAPEIDGDLSDDIWSRALPIDNFLEVFPEQGAEPSERTRVVLLHDGATLYIGVHAFDRTPDEITATVLSRDGSFDGDDFISILIDSYNTRRNAFGFELNPLGARRDGLIEDNEVFQEEWDTIWKGKARITEFGWEAEMAIPFRSIAYDGEADAWGLQIIRSIARRNEEIRWAAVNQSLGRRDMSRAGRLSGVNGIEPGLGLDVEMLSSIQWLRNWEERPRQDVTRFNPGGNISYRITPSLTGTLTVNTDFSDTPLDPRQVNVGRFDLFFPETRDFFLQDAPFFSFGGRAFNDTNALPFFSRRIGVVEGQLLGLDAGIKLSGSVKGVTIGALTARTEPGDDLDPQLLSVVRLSTPVFGESRAGVILTQGDPTGETSNTVAGVDFQFLDTSVFGDQRLVADAFFVASRSDREEEQGEAFGIEVAYPNDRINGFIRFKQVAETYRPALGFANRTGVRTYEGELVRRWRPEDSYIRFFDAGTFLNIVTDLENGLEDRENGVFLGGSNHIGDELFLVSFSRSEILQAPFFLPGDVLVPAGRYHWVRSGIELFTSSARPVNFSAQFFCCNFYDGRRRFLNLGLGYRPSGTFGMEISHLRDAIDLPTGEVTVHVHSLSMDYNWSPDLQLDMEVQYDNISESLGILARLFWEIRPETELFAAISLGATTDFNDFRTNQSGASFRIGNTFRF